MAKAKHDFSRALELFLSGLSLRQVSEELAIPLTTLHRRATKEAWQEQLDAIETQSELEQEDVESMDCLEDEEDSTFVHEEDIDAEEAEEIEAAWKGQRGHTVVLYDPDIFEA